MNHYLKLLLSLITVLNLSACTTTVPRQEPGMVHFYDYRWSLPSDPEQVLTTEQVAATLSGFDVIFFGELHDHPAIHLAQMELLAQLYHHKTDISLSMEQFERDSQPLLDQYLEHEIGEEHMIEKARAWPHYRSSYRPLVEFAREHRLAVIAANAPKQMVVCVGRSGLDVLERFPARQREYVAERVDISDGPYREKFFGVMHKGSAHGAPSDRESQGVMRAMAERSFAAQALRDDTMAESIARHLKRNPGHQVLHLNGDFHSAGFLGTVERLQQRSPRLSIAVIHVVTGEADAAGHDSYLPGSVLIRVQSVPEQFVHAGHREQWINKMMKKRMKNREKCPE